MDKADQNEHAASSRKPNLQECHRDSSEEVVDPRDQMNGSKDSLVVIMLKKLPHNTLQKCAAKFKIKGNKKREELITLIEKAATKKAKVDGCKESAIAIILKDFRSLDVRKCATQFKIKGDEKTKELIPLIEKAAAKEALNCKESVDTSPDNVTEDENEDFDTEDKCYSPFVNPKTIDEIAITQSTSCNDDMSDFQKMESLERKNFPNQDLSSCRKRVHFANQRPPIFKRTSYRGSKRELFVKPKKLMNPGVRLNKPQVVTPFVPTVTSTDHISLNFAASKIPVFQFGRLQTPFKRSVKSAALKPLVTENVNLQGGAKKKFGCLPYTGPLKAFEDYPAKKGNTCFCKRERRRVESRSFLKIVRTNRRYDLLMEMRGAN